MPQDLHNDSSYLTQHEALPGQNETASTVAVLGSETSGDTEVRTPDLSGCFSFNCCLLLVQIF